MTETIFCYCCRVHHPKDQMRPFPTEHGDRWRCIRSIEAASGGRSARDAFGQQQSEMRRTHFAATAASDPAFQCKEVRASVF